MPPPCGQWARAPFERAENRTAARLVDLWDARRKRGAEPLFAPTIGAAIRAGRWWAGVDRPGCQVVGEIDLRTPRPASRYAGHELDPARIMQAMLAASAVREIDRLAVMALFWIVHEVDGEERRVVYPRGSALILARLNAMMLDRFGGTFVEAHELDKPTAAKVPRKMIGRVLTADEATALLLRLYPRTCVPIPPTASRTRRSGTGPNAARHFAYPGVRLCVCEAHRSADTAAAMWFPARPCPTN